MYDHHIWCFLSTPVRVHGGLICIAFCLSVCDFTKIELDKKSLDQNSHWTKIHQTKIHIEGRKIPTDCTKITRLKSRCVF